MNEPKYALLKAQIVKLIRCLKKKNGEIAGLSGENDRLQDKIKAQSIRLDAMMDASELNEQKKLAYNKLKKVCKKQRYEYAKLESRMRNSDITNAYLLEEIKGLRLKIEKQSNDLDIK